MKTYICYCWAGDVGRRLLDILQLDAVMIVTATKGLQFKKIVNELVRESGLLP